MNTQELSNILPDGDPNNHGIIAMLLRMMEYHQKTEARMIQLEESLVRHMEREEAYLSRKFEEDKKRDEVLQKQTEAIASLHNEIRITLSESLNRTDVCKAELRRDLFDEFSGLMKSVKKELTDKIDDGFKANKNNIVEIFQRLNHLERDAELLKERTTDNKEFRKQVNTLLLRGGFGVLTVSSAAAAAISYMGKVGGS